MAAPRRIFSRNEQDALLSLPNPTDYYSIENLKEAELPEQNIIIFFSELLQHNVTGIVFETEEEVKRFANDYAFTIIQNEYPRFAHYLQFQEQIRNGNKKYWDTETPIPYFTDPLKGKLNYWMAIRRNINDEKYIALVMYIE